MLPKISKISLTKAALFKNTPIYVQFYITARCNLTCEQCNIIYANSDVSEGNINQIYRIADNLSEIGVAIVLLTGGEPFARKDLPEIINAFDSRGIHVRMQTNGYASEEQIIKAIESGGRDISISLDTLRPEKQDKINGGFTKSWHKALKAIALFSKYLPKKNSFASLGCVLQPQNIRCVKEIIEFGSLIDWHTSLVPVHTTDQSKPRGFRTFDQSLKFSEDQYQDVDLVIEEVRKMRNQGFLLYDSDKYLDDIKLFIKNKPITWREKNNNICDSPNLYFALLPNGEFAPCCDYRLKNGYPVYSKDFVKIYKNRLWRQEVKEVVSACEGCMYGSYPEMTISMRFMRAKIQRLKTFFSLNSEKKWPFTYEELLLIAEKIVAKNNLNI
jgi:MoaA/NifB/PqqE/SkfB family radical SAM enzyme